jgi:IS30 family transposase
MAYLARHQRDQLQVLKQSRRFRQTEMAAMIGCSQTTVSRELSRYSTREKKRFGDFESDLVVSCRSGSGAVATYAERTSMLFRAVKVSDQSADEFVRASHEAFDNILPGFSAISRCSVYSVVL